MANKPNNKGAAPAAPSQQTTIAPPKMTATRSKMVDPGQHAGKILRREFAQRGDQKFTYLDVFVDVDGVELKVGYAANKVTDRSQIGQLLTRFGFDVLEHEGEEVDWSVIDGEVTLETELETKVIDGREAKFARIKPDSLSPA